VLRRCEVLSPTCEVAVAAILSLLLGDLRVSPALLVRISTHDITCRVTILTELPVVRPLMRASSHVAEHGRWLL